MKMVSKKRILIFVDWFPPAYKAGGPIRSVNNLVLALCKDYEIFVITGNKDLGESQPLKGIETNKWLDKDFGKLIYLDESARTKSKYLEMIKEVQADRIYLNSLFSYSFSLLPLSLKKRLKIKFVIAPRGMLGEGALKIKSTKKKVFLTLAKTMGFYKDVVWHATNEKERGEIIKTFGEKADVRIAENLSRRIEDDAEQLLQLKKESFIEKKFLCVARLARVKNIELLIQSFSSITKKGWSLDIIGSYEDEKYVEELKNSFSADLPVKFLGPMDPMSVEEHYKKAHYFCLPSKSENFGHSIAEALSYACPVIVSDQTPWRGLEEKNIGWDLALDDDLWKNKIEEVLDWNWDNYAALAESSFLYAQKRNNDPQQLEDYRRLLE